MKIKILVESTCDLNKELINKYDLDVINMDFVVDGELCSSNKLDNEMLYKKMKEGAKCLTSQVSSNTYYEKYLELIKCNIPIVHLVFSSGLSGEIERAYEARGIIEKDHHSMIYIIDSKCASTGQGMLAIMVRQFAEKSNDINEILEYINDIKMRLNHDFSVDNLRYLANGGRLKMSSAVIGNILNIKPILKMNGLGKLEFMHNTISRRKAILELAKRAVERSSDNYCDIYISQADCIKDAIDIKNYIENNSNKNVIITSLGPVITCHSGPGTIAVYYISKENR